MIRSSRGIESSGRAPQLDIVLLGSHQCGKSSLVRRLLTSQLTSAAASVAAAAPAADTTATLGVEMFTLEQAVDGARRTLCFWDCSGLERLRPIVQQVIDHAKLALLVYDPSSEASFLELLYWRNECARLCPEARLVLVSARADQAEWAAVTPEAGQIQAREWGAEHLVTSSKTGLGIAGVMTVIAESGAVVG